MRDRPTPPASIPAYVRDGITSQDPETLHDIAEFAQALAEWKVQPDPEEIEDELEADEALEEIEESSDGAIVEKKVPCGKECGGCPHGPYRYRVTREGDSLSWEYLGKVEGE